MKFCFAVLTLKQEKTFAFLKYYLDLTLTE